MTTEVRLLALVTARDTALAQLGGCGDGCCIVWRPRGQHTNGGCRCNRDPILMSRLASANRYFAEEVARIARSES